MKLLKFPTLISLFVVILLLSACSKPTDTTSQIPNSPANDAIPIGNSETTAEETTETEISGFIVYTPEAFAQAKDKRRVLFFHAAWCPDCREAETDINAKLSQIPEDLVIFKTDYDTESELKKKFAITYQHTFVQVDSEGNQIKKWSGGNLETIIENAL